MLDAWAGDELVDKNTQWLLGVLQRGMVRTLQGSMTVALSDGTAPLEHFLWGGCRTALTGFVIGNIAKPTAYAFPLNWEPAVEYPGVRGTAEGSSVDGDGGLIQWSVVSQSIERLALPKDVKAEIEKIAKALRDSQTAVGNVLVVLLMGLNLGGFLAALAGAELLKGAQTEGLTAELEACARAVAINDELAALLKVFQDLAAIAILAGVSAPATDACDTRDASKAWTGLSTESLGHLATGLGTGAFAWKYEAGGRDDPVGMTDCLRDASRWLQPRDDDGYLILAGVAAIMFFDAAQYDPPSRVRLDQEPASGTSERQIPLIHLDASLVDFYWDDFQAGYAPSADNEWPDGDRLTGAHATSMLADERRRWGDLASPVIQFVQALDLAAILYRESLNGESVVLALSGVGRNTGPLADLVRTQLQESGWSCVDALLGGGPVSELLARLWKQAMIDNFVAWYALTVVWPERMPESGDQVVIDEEELDAVVPGLFELLGFLRSEGRRERVRRQLGVLEATTALGRVVAARSGGTVDALLRGMASGGLCDAWDALPCTDREELTAVFGWLSSCEPEFFDLDTFGDPRRPEDLTGLRDTPYADGPEVDPSVLRADDAAFAAPEPPPPSPVPSHVLAPDDLIAIRQADWLATLRMVGRLSTAASAARTRIDTARIRWDPRWR